MDENKIEILNVHSMYGPSGHTIVVNCRFTIYISEYPSVENSVLKYSGGVQTPVFVNYSTEQLNISGTYTATDVGDYTAIFTPKDGYAFADGAESKSVAWGIYYIWEKYNYTQWSERRYKDLVSSTQYGDTASSTMKNMQYYKQYTHNPITGTYSVNGAYSYLSVDAFNSGYKYGIVPGTDSTELIALFSVSKNYYELSVSYEFHEGNANWTLATVYGKGDTSYGQVHSINASEYPDNDKSGDYWYVKQ